MTHIPKNPFDHFDDWYRQAMRHNDVKDANAVTLAASTPDGMPSNRTILLKGHGPGGFIFYPNLDSRKGDELEANVHAAMCFYWAPLAKQVRIEGAVTPVSDTEANQYFVSRPLRSRIGAWASRQFQPLENCGALLKDMARETARFAFAEIARLPFWSGFRLIPQRMEFRKSGEYRLHDRLAYTLDENGLWQNQLLYPREDIFA